MKNTDHFEIYEGLKLAKRSDFGKCFSSFRETAFRLELLPRYSVSQEKVAFREYIRGLQQPTENFSAPWQEVLKSATARGGDIRRLRLFHGPQESYFRFELDWGYNESVKYGERIKFLEPSSDIWTEIETSLPFLKDLWIFDQSKIFFMDYDYIGRFLGVKEGSSELAKYYQEVLMNAYERGRNIEWANRIMEPV